MRHHNLLLVLGCVLHARSAHAVWTCSADADCSGLFGAVCRAGDCACPPGQQAVLGGTVCVDAAPYHTSSCVEDHQCTRLFSSFECRRNGIQETGSCLCRPEHHYFLGRCWRTADYAQNCSRDEECLSVLRDPFSLSCNTTCGCAEGFYERQRGECRRIGFAVGDGCVLDEDCQFEGGVCGLATLTCYDMNAPEPESEEESPETPETSKMASVIKMAARQHGAECGASSPCPAPFQCSVFGACVCPVGYYASDSGNICLAELGSPATAVEQCAGLFAVILDGICTCPANFYFEENMRDCIKATRVVTDSCVTDSNCHTFGAAARCGAPRDPWGLRSCECIPEQAVWDAGREMCRLFAGIGEACVVDSDCLAGELEIQCVQDSEGEGRCACPEGYLAVDGLCLTTGLSLGDACQATQECTETANTVCAGGACACDPAGYQEVDGACAPIIGGVCVEDSDCVIADTQCTIRSDVWTCQCRDQFVEYDDGCWPVVSGFEATCNVSAQCVHALGAAAACVGSSCACIAGHHYRDGACWPVTGLFDGCSRTSQCYLSGLSERVVCRNSLCQCDFDFPYSEEHHTCMSSAANVFGSIFVIISALIYLRLS